MAKTNIEDIDRNIYDIKNKDNYEFKMQRLKQRNCRRDFKKENEPEWMRYKAVKSIRNIQTN